MDKRILHPLHQVDRNTLVPVSASLKKQLHPIVPLALASPATCNVSQLKVCVSGPGIIGPSILKELVSVIMYMQVGVCIRASRQIHIEIKLAICAGCPKMHRTHMHV